jgi:hypothetical protein
LTVTNNLDDSSPGSLRYVIAVAGNGDTVVFGTALNGQTITLTGGPLLLNKNLTIAGPGAGLLTVSGNQASRVFEVASGATVALSGLTIANGFASASGGVTTPDTGGGIFNSGTLTINNSTLAGNSADKGGGIDNVGTLTVTSSTLARNSAGLEGGGIVNGGTLTVRNSTLAGNFAGDGGGIDNFGTLTVSNSTLAGNSGDAGGGIDNGGALTVNNTILAGNNAPTGPDISGHLGSHGHNLVGDASGGDGFDPSDLLNLDPRLGPLQDNGGPTPTMALLPDSPAIDAGGAPGLPGTDQRGFPRTANGAPDIGAFEVQVYRVYSTADRGGGSLRTALADADQAGGSVITFTTGGTINLASPLPDISRSVQILGPGANSLTVRRATGGNYRLFTVDFGTTVTIAGLTIAGGQVSDVGGGILNNGTLTVRACTVSGDAAGLGGGGIENDGTATVINSTVSGNTAGSGGGGIENGGTLTLTNSTLAGNAASSGGGIDNHGTLTVSNSTVADNAATADGGGLAQESEFGALNAVNTLVTGNTAPTGPDLSGALTSQGHNLIGNAAGGSGFDASDLVNVNPLLGPLQDNGGPTPTMALLPGSPALDAGANGNAPDTDQRGLPRVAGAALDIGAFESRGFTLAVAAGDDQSAAVGSAFGQPLVVSVSSPYGEPVQGGVVTFAAPAGGPFATFPAGSTAVLDAAGRAGVSALASAAAGTYTLTAAVAGSGSVVFHLVNAVPAAVTAGSQTVTQGAAPPLPAGALAGRRQPRRHPRHLRRHGGRHRPARGVPHHAHPA